MLLLRMLWLTLLRCRHIDHVAQHLP
jgi:hypothetical protein